MKLEITKEKVLEAASECSQAKEILKTLFPELFDDEKPKITFEKNAVKINGNSAIYIGASIYDKKDSSLHLDSSWIWEIEKEKIGYTLKFKNR